MLEKLENLFNMIKTVSCTKNKEDKHFDGLAFWKPIKEMLEKGPNISAQKWIKPPAKISQYLMTELPEFQTMGNGKTQIMKQNHFIIQTVRIPLTENPSLRKIMQVALNIGQCKGKGRKYDKILTNRTKLEHYISKKEIKNLSNELSDDFIEKLENLILSL